MKNKALVIITSCIGLFSLLCVWHDYRVDLMPNLVTELEEGKVNISVKKYSSAESKKHLSRDLLARDITPIQITIENRTNSTMSIENIDIPQASPSEIARSVTMDHIPRAIGYRIAGFIFWPFMIPATVDGIKTTHAHAKMKHDYEAKSMKCESVLPHSTLHRVLFVKNEDVKDEVNIIIHDNKSGKLQDYKIPIT